MFISDWSCRHTLTGIPEEFVWVACLSENSDDIIPMCCQELHREDQDERIESNCDHGKVLHSFHQHVLHEGTQIVNKMLLWSDTVGKLINEATSERSSLMMRSAIELCIAHGWSHTTAKALLKRGIALHSTIEAGNSTERTDASTSTHAIDALLMNDVRFSASKRRLSALKRLFRCSFHEFVLKHSSSSLNDEKKEEQSHLLRESGSDAIRSTLNNWSEVPPEEWQVYCDLDGVLCDFEGGVRDILHLVRVYLSARMFPLFTIHIADQYASRIRTPAKYLSCGSEQQG